MCIDFTSSRTLSTTILCWSSLNSAHEPHDIWFFLHKLWIYDLVGFPMAVAALSWRLTVVGYYSSHPFFFFFCSMRGCSYSSSQPGSFFPATRELMLPAQRWSVTPGLSCCISFTGGTPRLRLRSGGECECTFTLFIISSLVLPTEHSSVFIMLLFWARCQKAMLLSIFSKKWKAKTLQSDVEFDNLKLLVKSGIFKCISRVYGSCFFFSSGDDEGFSITFDGFQLIRCMPVFVMPVRILATWWWRVHLHNQVYCSRAGDRDASAGQPWHHRQRSPPVHWRLQHFRWLTATWPPTATPVQPVQRGGNLLYCFLYQPTDFSKEVYGAYMFISPSDRSL